ncbi:MAG: ABC transporter substrate-binding protein [Bdellovibrionales bacterium CG10_big_fil_rev_8_21_14_0_10_45_34]|nr:MAG: ABC transporter substrate-binding protein [Bdellovibrionales bacterium CG10_big_fil_rev_8_21_14_0_10_45_34]
MNCSREQGRRSEGLIMRVLRIFTFVLMALFFINHQLEADAVKIQFHAWGGDPRINRYIAAEAEAFKKLMGIEVQHIKIDDLPPVIKKVQSDKASGNLTKGTIDVVWLNGENFATMKKSGLLAGPLLSKIENRKYMNLTDPQFLNDFSTVTEGFEVPWGRAQFVFIWDRKRTPLAPQTATELLAYAKANPGRITYVRPPQFHGTTFLKQLLLELSTSSNLQKACTPDTTSSASAPLWKFLDELHPFLWRKAQTFPASTQVLHQMLMDQQLLMSMSFNPLEVDGLILKKELPAGAYATTFKKGGIANVHFLAIPFNSQKQQAALQWINHLTSPEAQVRKADVANWGDPTVLDSAKVPQGIKLPALSLRGPAQNEPHACWMEYIEREWQRRYGVAG